MADTIKYISLDNLELYDTLLKGRIDEGDAKALKTVGLSEDGKSLLFWKTTEPVGDTPPAYSIELPNADLSDVMVKVPDAVDGNVGVFQDGTIVDLGIVAEELATKLEVSTAIAEAIAATGHLTKEIVTVLPTADAAKPNVIYMLKDDTVTEGDAYEEWMLIGTELVAIGHTSVNIENFYTKEQTDGLISDAKESAISQATATASADATAKVDTALAEAKGYTDTKTKTNADNIALNTSAISTLNTTVGNHTTIISSHDSRITALESGVPDLATATDEDIMAFFN